jgi:hypothetical protein
MREILLCIIICAFKKQQEYSSRVHFSFLSLFFQVHRLEKWSNQEDYSAPAQLTDKNQTLNCKNSKINKSEAYICRIHFVLNNLV